MTVNNQKFVSVDVIAYELGLLYKSKTWNIGDVRTWCADVETNHIRDVETMTFFEGVDLTVTNGIVLLPCNVYRIYDVYDASNNQLMYNTNGAYLYDFKINGTSVTFNDNDVLYINYVGINVDDNGEILIVKGHETACKTWCKINAFEEDAAYGKFDKSMWSLWREEFSNQCLAARYNIRHKDRLNIDNINKIRGNMLPKIGSLILYHEMFK